MHIMFNKPDNNSKKLIHTLLIRKKSDLGNSYGIRKGT